MIIPRKWQSEFLQALASHKRDNFLLVACPAAGKTMAGAAGAAQSMEQLNCDQLIVVVPTLVVREQWVATLKEQGFVMLAGCPRDGLPPWVHGAVLTYAELVWRRETLADACRRRGTIVICDEIHHAGRERIWGPALEEALRGAKQRLLLSGTPFRSDSDAIPWVRYSKQGTCRADFTYDYRRAVREGVCRKIVFRAHDGAITWSNRRGSEESATFAQTIANPESRRRLRAALDPTQPYLRSILEAADNDLTEHRIHNPDAGGLVICETQAHARVIDRLLGRISGETPTLAISDEPGAHTQIRRFAQGEARWLVSVRMVAEGVDIPRLSVIAFCSGGTELMVKQVAGRALRSRLVSTAVPAVVHIPADPELCHYAEHLDAIAGVSTRVRLKESPTTVAAETQRDQLERMAYRPPERGAVSALPAGPPALLVPPQPESGEDVPETGEQLTIAPPEIPLSPQQIAAEKERQLAQRGEVLRLLNVWTQLRREQEPGFQMGAAHAELAAAVGAVGSDAPQETVESAVDWLQAQLREIVAKNPKAVKTIARAQRRLQLAHA